MTMSASYLNGTHVTDDHAAEQKESVKVEVQSMSRGAALTGSPESKKAEETCGI
jgi:hypothetical protein